jgi:hypothetical protein
VNSVHAIRINIANSHSPIEPIVLARFKFVYSSLISGL